MFNLSFVVSDKLAQVDFSSLQIRGVATKQLVHDAVFSVPAKFISYQQVVCSLPQLAIHSPDEITNFDLKENTDHTRCYHYCFKISFQFVTC